MACPCSHSPTAGPTVAHPLFSLSSPRAGASETAPLHDTPPSRFRVTPDCHAENGGADDGDGDAPRRAIAVLFSRLEAGDAELRQALRELDAHAGGLGVDEAGAFAGEQACAKYERFKPVAKATTIVLRALFRLVPGQSRALTVVLEALGMLDAFASAAFQAPPAAFALPNPSAVAAGFSLSDLKPVVPVVLNIVKTIAEAVHSPTIKVTNGYGSVVGAKVIVTKDVRATLTVDFSVTTLGDTTFDAWLDKAPLPEDQRLLLKSKRVAGGNMGSVLCSALGVVMGHAADKYVNKADEDVRPSTDEQRAFLKSLADLPTAAIRIHGEVQVVGESPTETVATVFLQLTRVKFPDGPALQVYDTASPRAATPSGATTGLRALAAKLSVLLNS